MSPPERSTPGTPDKAAAAASGSPEKVEMRIVDKMPLGPAATPLLNPATTAEEANNRRNIEVSTSQ